MNMDAFNDIHSRGRIEPEASAAQDDAEVAMISIAVSLKRIADVLENVTFELMDGQNRVLRAWDARSIVE